MKRRIAVSTLLTRDPSSSEIYLVERAPQLVFFGGYRAFPGGTLEAEDSALKVHDLTDGHLLQDPGMGAFVAAAARELFEETGLWIARGGLTPSAATLSDYRRQLMGGDSSFSALLRREQQHVSAADFEPICRIMTPPFTPVRYDTWFFKVKTPADQRIEIWEGELRSGEFAYAADALRQWLSGDYLIVPPVLIMLRMLQHSNATDFMPAVRKLTDSYARGKLHRVYFNCGVLLAPLATHTRPPATHTNAYLVGEQKLYLIDPGSSDVQEQHRLWELIDTLVAEGSRLEAILLTHYHPDHTGAVEACRRRYDVSLLAHPLGASVVGATGTIDEGDRLELGVAPDGSPNWGLEVFHLPGHSRDHLAFREDRYGQILVGDLVSTLSSILIDPAEGDLTTYLHSLGRLEQLATSQLYPGHGPPAREGARLVARQIEHRQRREQQIIDALSNVPRDLESLLQQVYAGTPPDVMGLARRSLVAGLQKLEAEGRIEEASEGFRLAEF